MRYWKDRVLRQFAHTISRIEPLDIYFNRQKNLIGRHVFDRIQVDDIDIKLS